MDSIDWDAVKKAIQINEPEVKADDEVDVVYEGIEYRPKNDQYAQLKRLKIYYKEVQKVGYKTDSLKPLFDQLYDILEKRNKKVRDVIIEDLKELDSCFASGAYKATLILAGSILEAILLDWLSENDGKDYFQVPYKVPVTKNDGSTVWVVKEELSTYIEKIDDIEKPYWMQKDNAHAIRKKRNLVHAKLCLKDEVGVNEETCNEVIKYLKEIVETRLNKLQTEIEE